jgi:hypothetical protein
VRIEGAFKLIFGRTKGEKLVELKKKFRHACRKVSNLNQFEDEFVLKMDLKHLRIDLALTIETFSRRFWFLSMKFEDGKRFSERLRERKETQRRGSLMNRFGRMTREFLTVCY